MERSFVALCELFVKEFIDVCREELAIYLRQRDPENLNKAAKVAEQFLVAHGRNYTPHPSRPNENIAQAMERRTRKEENQAGGCNASLVQGMALRNQTNFPLRLKNAVFCAIALGIWQETSPRDKNTKKVEAALHCQGHPPENDTGLESCIHGDELLLKKR
jgi:hypothetical protein